MLPLARKHTRHPAARNLRSPPHACEMYDAILAPSDKGPGDLLAISTKIVLGKHLETVRQEDMNSVNTQDVEDTFTLTGLGNKRV